MDKLTYAKLLTEKLGEMIEENLNRKEDYKKLCKKYSWIDSDIGIYEERKLVDKYLNEKEFDVWANKDCVYKPSDMKRVRIELNKTLIAIEKNK